VATFGFWEFLNSDLDSAAADLFRPVEVLLENLQLPADHLQSPGDLLQAAATMAPQLWPSRVGRLIRRGADRSIVDVHAATGVIGGVSSYEAGGRQANSRSAHFEEVVQQLIDETPWAPSDGLRSLKRKQLRLRGATLTDLDAVGERDGTLLIVSCKGRVFDQRLDRGDYAAVRNVGSAAHEAVRDLADFVATLKAAHGKGDNFDLSAYSKFVGVVCLPQPIFLSLEIAWRMASSGLRTVVWPNELEAWLRR
jgi:hypothetical protein